MLRISNGIQGKMNQENEKQKLVFNSAVELIKRAFDKEEI
jgi:hypothetical protein